MGQKNTKTADNRNDTYEFIESERSREQTGSRDSKISINNGLILNNMPLPEEVIVQILSYVTINSIPKCLLVCKKWNEIITSPYMWRIKCSRVYKKTTEITNKKLPWYAYYAYFLDEFFDKNLIKNNCGQEEFKYWKIKSNGGDRFIVESTPAGAETLPKEPEFLGYESCFATSYQNCSKFQTISFKNHKLYQKIFDELRPTIHVSEWYAGRFDCGCEYKLSVWLIGKKNELMAEETVSKRVEQWAGAKWEKVELPINNYPKGLTEIQFFHKGSDTQFWAGHYGSKMSGAVVKILWDSIAK